MARGRNCTQISHTTALLFPLQYTVPHKVGPAPLGARCYPGTEENGVNTAHNLKWEGPSRKGVSSQGPRVCWGLYGRLVDSTCEGLGATPEEDCQGQAKQKWQDWRAPRVEQSIRFMPQVKATGQG